MWSKRQIVEDAFGELSIAGYDFDLSPEELQSACRRLDTLMAELVATGMNLGYVFGLTPNDSDLDQDSGLPLIAVGAVRQKLAISIAASKGKQLSRSTLSTAKSAMDALVSSLARDELQTQGNPSNTIRGAGYRNGQRRPFFRGSDTSPIADGDGVSFGD